MEDMCYSTITPRKKRYVYFFSLAQFECSLPMRCSHPLSLSLSLSLSVLHMSLRDSATAVCFNVSVGGISGIPVCGRRLPPGSPSICRLSQSCTLLPSFLPSSNLPLSLCFHLTLPCLTLFSKQRDIFQSVTNMMTETKSRRLLS